MGGQNPKGCRFEPFRRRGKSVPALKGGMGASKCPSNGELTRQQCARSRGGPWRKVLIAEEGQKKGHGFKERRYRGSQKGKIARGCPKRPRGRSDFSSLYASTHYVFWGPSSGRQPRKKSGAQNPSCGWKGALGTHQQGLSREEDRLEEKRGLWGVPWPPVKRLLSRVGCSSYGGPRNLFCPRKKEKALCPGGGIAFQNEAPKPTSLKRARPIRRKGGRKEGKRSPKPALYFGWGGP